MYFFLEGDLFASLNKRKLDISLFCVKSVITLKFFGIMST